jgi:hypothetical protein
VGRGKEMNYTPQTNWVGGEYPGVVPAHLHRVPKKVRPNVGHKRRDIVAYARVHGPVCAVDIAAMLKMPLDSVRGQLRICCNQKLVVKEERQHSNKKNRIMYYSGVQ